MNFYFELLHGTFSLFHILFMIFGTAFLVVSMILLHKYVKEEKAQRIVLMIAAGLTLFIAILNRIWATIGDVQDGHSWLMFLPHSVCSLAVFVITISVLVGKKNNAVSYSAFIYALFGGFSNIVYPDTLNEYPGLPFRTLTSLFFHFFMFWLVIYMLLIGYFKFTMKKIYYPLIFYCVAITLGVFEMQNLGFAPKECMNIGASLLDSFPILTSWYALGIGFFLGHVIYTIIHNLVVDKMTLKQILTFQDPPQLAA